MTIHLNNPSTGLSGLIDHGTTTGLSDDDHTQYALLAGRTGGQTLGGSIDSGGNLTLQSTSHATKGKILFGTSAYDEVNNRLGIGTTGPGDKLDVNGNLRLSASGTDSKITYNLSSDGLILQPLNTNTSSGLVLLPSGTATNANLVLGGASTLSGNQVFMFGGGFSGAPAGTWAFGSTVYANATGVGRDITFVTGDATGRHEVLRLTNAGNVGIGTTSPGARLQVNPTAAVIGQILKGAVSQSADLLQIQDSSATVLAAFGADGVARIATKTPSSAADTGTTGMIAWDADYIYICTATNTWKRTSLSTW